MPLDEDLLLKLTSQQVQSGAGLVATVLMATSLNTRSKSKSIRGWRTFSLRSLLIVTVLSSIALGYIGRRLIPQSRDTTLVEKLEALGADISYDYEAIRQDDIQPKHSESGRSSIFGNYPDAEVVSVGWHGHGTSPMPFISDRDVLMLLKLPKLTEVTLGGPQVTDAGIMQLANHKGLTGLTIVDSSVSRTGVEALAKLNALRSLRLAGNSVTDDVLLGVGTLPQLTEFELSYTRASAPGLAGLASLSRLERLEMYGDSISDDGLEPLRHLHSLKHVTLFRTGVNGPGLAHFRSASELKELCLWGSAITDDGGAPLAALASLETLTLRETNIGDRGVALLPQLRSLRELDLSFTQITDEVVPHLTQFERLETLDIIYTRVTDHAIQQLKSVKSLKRIVLGPHVGQEAARTLKRASPQLDVSYIDEDAGWIEIMP